MSKATVTAQCCKSMPVRGMFNRWRQCKRPSVVERDGQFYCKQHDPVEVDARRRAANDRDDRRSDAMFKRHQRQAALEQFASGTSTERVAALTASGWTLNGLVLFTAAIEDGIDDYWRTLPENAKAMDRIKELWRLVALKDPAQ